jgi:hypothetical protein
MTRRFSAQFRNGVLVPNVSVTLPENQNLDVVVDDVPIMPQRTDLPRYDDPNDPMPAGGVELVDWWRRHKLPMDPIIGERIARSKAYGYYEEPDDDS